MADLFSWPAYPAQGVLKLSRRPRTIKPLFNENKPYGQDVRNGLMNDAWLAQTVKPP
jgi:hypothetical protein